MKVLIGPIIFFSLTVCGLLGEVPEEAQEDGVVKRIYAHLQIKDYASACDEGKAACESFPDSVLILEAYIKALANAGDELSLRNSWNRYYVLHEKAIENHDLLETMAWGIITVGSRSTSPVIRIMALLGAFFGQDSKGVDILCRNMRDQNSLIRATAVKLAGSLKDMKLQDQIKWSLHYEKNWNVRIAAVRSAGQMKIEEAKPMLLSIIGDDHSMAEEKASAIEALVALTEDVNREEVMRLAQSNRSDLRLLACELVEFLDLIRDVDLIFPLLQDHHADVRVAALRTLGLLRVSTIDGQTVPQALFRSLNDRDPKVAITAAWMLMFYEGEEGQKAMKPWLDHPIKEVRRFAAAALAASGKYGMPLMREAFQHNGDLFVRMNLAIGLIGQRILVQQACEVLGGGLKQCHERLMWDEEGAFKVLAPSDLKHDDLIPNYPETVNQQTRLEILNILAMMKYPDAQQAVRMFLQEKSWGISGVAAALLLVEGDESAVELVEKLLVDPNQKIRVQAALVLALWGNGEKAVNALMEVYEAADRDTKEKILEGLGRIGAASTIPFLVEKMQEPYPSLRIIAAGSLLQCLYH